MAVATAAAMEVAEKVAVLAEMVDMTVGKGVAETVEEWAAKGAAERVAPDKLHRMRGHMSKCRPCMHQCRHTEVQGRHAAGKVTQSKQTGM